MEDETNVVSKRSTRIFQDEDCSFDLVETTPFPLMATRKGHGGHEDMQSDKESESETPASRSSHSSSSSISSLEFAKSLTAGIIAATPETSLEGKGAGKGHKDAKPRKIPGIPINFGTVCTGIYRSAYPQIDDYEYLASLKLKTLVTLVETPQPAEFQGFIKENDIRHIVIVMKGTKKAAISQAVMLSIMEVVLDRENHPLLMHCNQGKHRTGCVVAVLRKVMGWHVEDAVAEYTKYSFPKERETDLHYIRNFQVDTLDDVIHMSQWRQPTSQWPSSRCMRAAQYFLFGALAVVIWVASGMKFWY